MENKTQAIYTKKDISWYYAYLFLEAFGATSAIHDDGFNKLFKELYDYVIKKIDTPSDNDIIDTYVVIEQFPDSL